MAAAEPHRYVVVDADGTPDDVAARVLAALDPVLPAPAAGVRAGATTRPLTPPPVGSNTAPPAGSSTATAVVDPDSRAVRER
jgi:hypothetical protein